MRQQILALLLGLLLLVGLVLGLWSLDGCRETRRVDEELVSQSAAKGRAKQTSETTHVHKTKI